MDQYVDVDFTGLFISENNQATVSVKSRTGCVVTLAGILVTWVSKPQSEIALPTMEAEYIALYTGM